MPTFVARVSIHVTLCIRYINSLGFMRIRNTFVASLRELGIVKRKTPNYALMNESSLGIPDSRTASATWASFLYACAESTCLPVFKKSISSSSEMQLGLTGPHRYPTLKASKTDAFAS